MEHSCRVGIVACSNGLPLHAKEEMLQLNKTLCALGTEVIWSDFIYAKDGVRNGTGKERADALMNFYRDKNVDFIFDVSGGDVSQEVLDYLDYEVIAAARGKDGKRKVFWGYSDLTVLLNAIYAKTGNPGVLYQVRYIENMLQNNVVNMNETEAEIGTGITEKSLCGIRNNLFTPRYHFLRGEEMSGVLVGGNVRCLLKLSDTEYFPDMTGKILFLEARSGFEKEMRSYLSQLQQMGVFEKINGLFLGTFTRWDEENIRVAQQEALRKEKALKQGVRTKDCGEKEQMTMERLVLEYIPKELPVAKTLEVGHASTSKAIRIGEHLHLLGDGVLEYIENEALEMEYNL